MKRMLLYIGILASVLAVPIRPSNVGELLPVQVVAVYEEQGQTVLETDTGNRGVGENAVEALANMKATALGNIYLDTAEYLLIGKNAQEGAEALRGELKGSVRVCMLEEPTDLSNAGLYLDVHGKLPKLRFWNEGAELPVLRPFEDSFTFLKKVENNA